MKWEELNLCINKIAEINVYSCSNKMYLKIVKKSHNVTFFRFYESQISIAFIISNLYILIRHFLVDKYSREYNYF